MLDVPGWPAAFRGSRALAAGRLSRRELRGPRYRRVFPDTYVRRRDELTLALRSHAAYRHAEGRAVLSGYSAAELLGASCGPRDAPAEITCPGGGRRRHPGLITHRDRLAPGEIQRCGAVRVTTPLRTAWDLARRGDLVESVVAVDALARVGRFAPDLLLNFAVHYPRARGVELLPSVLAAADRRSGSPMETRLRLLLVHAGLPRPQVQWVVQDAVAREAVWLDLAYPEHWIGVEYEGEWHTRPERVLADIRRATRLVDQGWRLYRYTKLEIYSEPDRIVSEVRRGLARAAGALTSATPGPVPAVRAATRSRPSAGQPASTTLPSSAEEASSGCAGRTRTV